MTVKINGIQQLGVGVSDLHEAWKWYRLHFSMDIRMFEDEAVAELMLAHTEGKTRKRHAVLALNMQGGGGFEIWQHKGKKPESCPFEIQIGDLGINIGILKTTDIEKAYNQFVQLGVKVLGPLSTCPSGNEHFFIYDPYNNLWEVRNEKWAFNLKNKGLTGGIFGVVIGVKNMEESLPIYQNILQYDKVIYDKTGIFDDFKSLPGGNQKLRRILLQHTDKKEGAFSPFFGHSVIELVQAIEREPNEIYKGRIWGDPGFIHLCFDINGIDTLREQVKDFGFPFTVDSAEAMDTFDMGEAAGSFAYIQAPEGTLIEFVETHRIPIVKKIGWYLDLRKRGHHPLPNWILNLFRFMKVKN